MAELKVSRANEGEEEISSVPVTHVAGISQSLVGAEDIHMAIVSVPPGSKSNPIHRSTARLRSTSSEVTGDSSLARG